MMFEYLLETYGENEPIFVSEIRYMNMSIGSIRQQIMKLSDAGKIKRYDSGIYYIPKKSIFRSGSQLSWEKVLEKKYLKDENEICGYISGVAFANQLGLTTQVSMVSEVVTNKATKDYRETKLANSKVILRKPRVIVDNQNYYILQLLDLIKDADYIIETPRDEVKKIVVDYMKYWKIGFGDFEKYLKYYPERIFKNMYEMGLLNGIFA